MSANMSPQERQALIDAIGQTIVDEVKTALEPVKQELARLTLKLEHAELRARELRYAGTWNAGAKYRKGNFVTHSGSLWACLIDDIHTIPGSDFDGWQLAVKSMARA
jgi:hypothetical protein